MSRIYISAAHKSSGKTTISIGLCAAFSATGLKVQPFKKGPDYIDPLWLASASGLSRSNDQNPEITGCYNIDFNTQSDQEILQTVVQNSLNADISLIEGNKGLYDGVALDGSDSNAAMAKLTQSPVVLVIDSRGVTRGVAPLLLGYQHFDSEVNIAGVIFNLAGGARHEQKLRSITEEYTDIPVLGVIRKATELELDERHLGLMPRNEDQNASHKITEIEKIVRDSVDLDRLIDISGSVPKIQLEQSEETINGLSITRRDLPQNDNRIRIGICEDAAFGFYYTDDKQALINAGAELVSIDTINDACLPDDLDGLFIGGGFPETQMQQLADNTSMRNSIRNAIEAGLPTYAECGGLMYLTRSLEWHGKTAKMVGVIPADTLMHKKPQGRGHVVLQETPDMLWGKCKDKIVIESDRDKDINKHPPMINAHEFHYSRLINISGIGKFAYNVHRGVGITGDKDGWIYKNLLANYSHLRNTESFKWAKKFVDFVKENKQNRQF